MTIKSSVLFSFFAFFLSIAPTHGQLGSPTILRNLTDADWQKLAAHPRLFANNARFEALKGQKDSTSKILRALLKADAERKILAKNINYTEGVNSMTTAREVQGRILSLALAYRVFGDKRYFEKAKTELLQLADLKGWGVGHFLDVGEAALAAGVGLDWLYADLSAAERQKIATAIIEKALLPSLKVKDEPNSWLKGNFNWNPVCHGGLTAAALAVSEFDPLLTRQIVERAVQYVPFAGAAYAPDGAFAEGPSYWSYGTSFYVFLIETLRSALGTSCGLEQMQGFLKTPDYKIQMVGATGEDFNYSDYHAEHFNEPIMFWFAKETGNAALLQRELRDLKQLHTVLVENNPQKASKTVVSTRHSPLGLLWWQPELLAQKTIAAPLHWTADGEMPIATMRTAWNDTNATFVALKGGTPNNSHGHMDCGSFILEADGVRWAVDLGTESYDKMRAAKLDLWNYNQNSSRWTTFRVGSEGHNILRFDNDNQDITGKATLKKLPDTEGGTIGNKADLTSLYAQKAKRVERIVLLHKDRSVSIQDAWTTKDTAVVVAFQWLTKAQVTATKNGFLLQQNGHQLYVDIEKNRRSKHYSVTIEDVSQPQNKQDSPNPNLKRIVIRLKTAAHSEGQLHIKAHL